ncbi:unnamed protein product [Candida verbasci]|uniref:Cell wall mannoprotein PIR1-like C-terminal domain-containing protein n=1 Tax=Candida verbasci TaxID=1227364 RepID=A0A9W4X918_9ASCO|nr:unnamed protein product [Candida verbasci]
MKFAITSLALGIFVALTSAAAVVEKRGGEWDGYEPTKTYDDGGGITSFPNIFALGVKDYGDGSFTTLDLVYEIDDGQLIYDKSHPYHVENYDDCETEKPPRPTSTSDCETEKPPRPSKIPYHDGWQRENLEARGYETKPEDNWGSFKYPFLKIEKSQHNTFFNLKDTVLRTVFSNKIVEIVANHQLQADSPVQPDALFTKGFSIVYKHGAWLLALNGSTKFFNAVIDSTKTSFKIYDAPITSESKPIELVVIVVKGGHKW